MLAFLHGKGVYERPSLAVLSCDGPERGAVVLGPMPPQRRYEEDAMADKVFANGRAAIHKASAGKSIAFPDVCLCPHSSAWTSSRWRW